MRTVTASRMALTGSERSAKVSVDSPEAMATHRAGPADTRRTDHRLTRKWCLPTDEVRPCDCNHRQGFCHCSDSDGEWDRTQSLFDLAVQLERDVTEAQADEAYRIVTQALRERGFRFAAQLRIIPEQPKAEVRSSMNTLWTGGDLGG